MSLTRGYLSHMKDDRERKIIRLNDKRLSPRYLPMASMGSQLVIICRA